MSKSQIVDIDSWNRREHYQFFNQFEEPFFGITTELNCTAAYQYCKAEQISFFLYYLYQALAAAQKIENFRYRIVDGKVHLFEQINASPTIMRPDGTFGFSYMDYSEDFDTFYANAILVRDTVKVGTGLTPAVSGENVIHFSTLPWIRFSSVSHARSFAFPDSAPKVTFGKLTIIGDQRVIPVSVHAHHGLIDGYHVGLYFDALQERFNQFVL
jgi:chloramphenicol O-acetyltransferase type A